MVILTILDGWGHGNDPSRSAIYQANTPNMDQLYKNYPHAELLAHGKNVGLPDGQMGNSEVGHLNIGAGRVVYQELARINKAIEEDKLRDIPVLKAMFKKAKAEKRKLHFMGLVSDGGVHSHIDHLKALCDLADDAAVQQTYIHAFLDGRDTDPKSGAGFIQEIEEHIQGKNIWLASMIGRFYAMDRDNRWERVKKAYDLLVNKKADDHTKDPVSFLKSKYEQGVTDEFMTPTLVFTKEDNPVKCIENGDLVLFFNFRTDRPREITIALTQKDQPQFDMKKLDLDFATMTLYDSSFKGIEPLFTKDNLKNTLGEVLSKAGKTQLRIAETEKYPHVTFFFSGGREETFEGESRILVPSPKVDTYDKAPDMSAREITSKLIDFLRDEKPDFVCLNYANADMVGHTGVFSAAVRAAETVDECVGLLNEVALELGYHVVIIADHGNSDYMINPDGSPNTAHTTNPVPAIIVGKELKGSDKKVEKGVLADVAPTILHIMGIEQPGEMTGKTLINLNIKSSANA
jgi:2,3-bisphosphoglycerate-independent phosphoglycerate mutase